MRNEAKFTEHAEQWFYRYIPVFLPGSGGRFTAGGRTGFTRREKNAGWRIDYFCVSEALKDRLQDAKIHTEVTGSDHCPVELDIEL